MKAAVIEANFDWTVVKVETDEGLTGWGEGFFAPGLAATIREMRDLLLGEDPRQVVPLVTRLRLGGSATFGGNVHHAIAAIETALWDVAAQAAGVPLWRLWGGRYRDRVRIYADAHGGDALESLGPMLNPRRVAWEPSARSAWSAQSGNARIDPSLDVAVAEAYSARAYAERAAALVAEGYTAVKFDLDVPNPYAGDRHAGTLTVPEVRHLVSLMAAVRQSVPETIEVMADCHWKFAVPDAIRLARALADVGLTWLEDPIASRQAAALAGVRHAGAVPILTGENLYRQEEFQELLDLDAVDILAPDFQKTGLTEGWLVAQRAHVRGVVVAPHCIAGPIGFMASVHLMAVLPNAASLEFHAHDVPFFDALAHGSAAPIIQRGFVAVPDAAGLGVRLDEEVARRYAKPGEPFFD